MSISRTAAIQQARAESSMYRQGGGWIISTYDPQVECNWLTEERPYYLARQQLADWRVDRALELVGRRGDKRPPSYYDHGGRIEQRVARILA